VHHLYELDGVAQAHTALASAGSFGKHLVRVSPGLDGT
jgi:hypothetical protein